MMSVCQHHLPSFGALGAVLLLVSCSEEQTRNGLPFVVEGRVGDGPTYVIPTGDLVPTVADGRWFGSHLYGSSQTTTFTIRNLSNQPISFANSQPVAVTAGDLMAFTVAGQAPQELGPSATATFSITYAASSPSRVSNAVVTLNFDRAQGQIYSMGVGGTSFSPESLPAPALTMTWISGSRTVQNNDILSLGSLDIGQTNSVSSQFLLSNTGVGGDALSIFIENMAGTNPDNFKTAPAAGQRFTLAPGASIPLTIFFESVLSGGVPSATAPLLREATLSLENNGRGSQPFTVRLQGLLVRNPTTEN